MGLNKEQCAVLDYFAKSVENSALVPLDTKETKRICELPLEVIKKGKVEASRIQSLFSRNDNQAIDVVVAIRVVKRKINGSLASRNAIGLVLVKAQLNRRGVMTFDPKFDHPWIPCNCLENKGKLEASSAYTVGTLQAYWKYALTHVNDTYVNDAGQLDWNKYVNAALNMLQEVRSSIQFHTDSSWYEDPSMCMIVKQNVVNAYGEMAEIYKDLQNGNRSLPLLETMLEKAGQHEVCPNSGSSKMLPQLPPTKGLGLLGRLLTKICAHFLKKKESQQKAVQHLPRLVSSSIPGQHQHAEALDEVRDQSRIISSMLEYGGTASGKNALADSQRVAVHHFTMLEKGDVLALSGPPGTGKTSTIQSMIATEIVRHALDGKPAPVIVGTATNNQAVENLIKSFSNLSSENQGPLDVRWMPAMGTDGKLDGVLPGIGCIMPAKHRVAGMERRGFLVESQDKAHSIFLRYSNEDYLCGALPLFLQNAQRLGCFHGYFSPSLSGVKALQEELRHTLCSLDGLRRTIIDVCKSACEGLNDTSSDFSRLDGDNALDIIDGFLKPSFRNVFALHVLDENAKKRLLAWNVELKGGSFSSSDVLLQIDKVLDTTLRVCEFWLAVHINEAQWFIDCIDKNICSPSDHAYRTLDVCDRYWTQMADLAPVIVMTTAKLPNAMRIHMGNDGELSRDFERFDLLIVDEAGQVDTSKGLGVFAFARKAIVTGDESQIAPIWSFDKESDCAIAQYAGIDQKKWERLSDCGLAASDSTSLMKVARQCTRWDSLGGEAGLFLKEHYRCRNQIITYCNELMYENRLIPSRKEKDWEKRAQESFKNIVQYPLSFVFVPDSSSDHVGSSRANDAECQAIVSWLREHHDCILEYYRQDGKSKEEAKEFKDLVAIVTPFKAQAQRIKGQLKKCGKEYEHIVCDTAHRLQGAECPIVLYSSVYGENNDTTPFVTNNINMMNVAVSRAQDAFVMFCAPRGQRDNNEVMSLFFKLAKEAPLLRQKNQHILEASRFSQQKKPVWGTIPQACIFEHAISMTKLVQDMTNPETGFSMDAKQANKILIDKGYLERPSDSPKDIRCTELGQAIGIVQTQYKENGRLYCVYPPKAQAKVKLELLQWWREQQSSHDDFGTEYYY